MRKFFRAVETITKHRAGSDYPHKTRPIVYVSGEPGITVKPFTKIQTEGILRITRERVESAFRAHFPDLGFKTNITQEGSEPTFHILPELDISIDGPIYISVSRLPAEIEFNFKRSSRHMSKQNRRKYFMFLLELLGEPL